MGIENGALRATLHTCHSFASLLFLKVHDSMCIQKSLQESQTLQAIKTDGSFGAFFLLLLLSLPMKNAQNLVAEKERLLHMCVFSMAPVTNVF